MPLQELPKNTELQTQNKFEAKDIITLTKALGACQLAQRTYGKQADNLDKVADIFVRLLKNHEPQKVIEAIKQWLLTEQNFPTPADIENILNPKPKFDFAVYNRIQNKLKIGDYVSEKEHKYLKLYEEKALKGL